MSEKVPSTPPDSEAIPPAHLSPITGCPKNVLDRSRLEFYAALCIGIVAAVLPMSGLTRSLLLLLVLAPLVDVAWRSPWCHIWKRASKIMLTVLLVGIYLAVAATLIFRDYESAALAVKTYLTSKRAEPLYHWLYFLAGCMVAYLSLKLFSLLKVYLKSRSAARLAALQKFRETKKGWLDYQIESEESSKHLHYLIGRLTSQMGRNGRVLRVALWLAGEKGEKPPIARTQILISFITLMCEKSSERMEAKLKELEVTADIFMESTEGYLKTLKIVTKNDYLRLAGLHYYFEDQLKDVRELANGLSELPPIYEKMKGVTQDSTAAINRQVGIWKSQVVIMRRVEGHCARMAKLTENYFERGLKKISKEMAATLQTMLELLKQKRPKLIPDTQDSAQNSGVTPNS